MHHPTERIAHIMTFVIQVVEHRLDYAIAYINYFSSCIHASIPSGLSAISDQFLLGFLS